MEFGKLLAEGHHRKDATYSFTELLLIFIGTTPDICAILSDGQLMITTTPTRTKTRVH